MTRTILYIFIAAWGILSVCASMTDKATGISFLPKLNDLNIFGVGVRKKGPIKVYSVGMYSSDEAKEELATVSRGNDKGQKAAETLRKLSKENPTTFLLQMNFKVGAEKMANAIAESVSPRHKDSAKVNELKEVIYNGVAPMGAVKKGNTIEFNCTSEGIAVSVDGELKGQVESGDLAKSFCDVYLDDKSVSTTLRDSCIENCCPP